MTNMHADPFRETQKNEIIINEVEEYSQNNDIDIVEGIHRILKQKELLVPFSRYLIRYLHEEKFVNTPPEETTVNEYKDVLHKEFEKNNTPTKWDKNLGSIMNCAIKGVSHLQQVDSIFEGKNVARSTVFLLGFGLNLNSEDVNYFLDKGIKQRKINPKNPFEVLCWYCYDHSNSPYKYEMFKKLVDEYYSIEPANETFDGSATALAQECINNIRDERTLMKHLSKLKATKYDSIMSVTMKAEFNRLLDEVKVVIAEEKNNKTRADIEQEAIRECQKKFEADWTRTEYTSLKEDIQNYTEEKLQDAEYYTASDICNNEIQKAFNDLIPLEASIKKYQNLNKKPKEEKEYTNLVKESLSDLKRVFGDQGLRIDRQRLVRLINNETPISRTDLLTLNFYIVSKNNKSLEKYERRQVFCDSSDKLLQRCMLGDINPCNTYEAFLLMCMRTDDPFETYSFVMSESYPEDCFYT